ncbi:MAG: 3-dehydroquinate synthase [Bacteroidales bacterium]|nr:3-dehydroquinate synthase [Bacteroidales bacterium]
MQLDSSYLHLDASFTGLTSFFGGYSGVFNVVDSKVADSNPIIAAYVQEHKDTTFLLEATEKTKTMTTVEAVCNFLIAKHADRKALVVGIGGGITTDIVGFAAAIYKRGVACGYVPTTVLGAVDAAVGGKSGVNVGELKNMLGAIRQPKFVFFCPALWESIPDEVAAEGWAELVKMQIIRNLNVLTAKYVNRGASPSEAAIFAAARAKLDIVEADETEQNLRRILNLGHTYAHAIEALSSGAVSHGNAVSIGLVLSAETSVRLGICKSPGIVEVIKKKLLSYGLPVDCPYSKPDMLAAICNDKKMEGGKIHFIAIRNLFDVVDVLIEPELL